MRRSVIAAAVGLGALGCLVAACSSSERAASGAREENLGAGAAPAATCYSVLKSDVAPAAIDHGGLFWLSTDDAAHTNGTFSVQSVGLDGQGLVSSPRASDPDGDGAATLAFDHDDVFVATSKRVWSLALADQANKAPAVLYDLDQLSTLGATRELAPGGAAVDDTHVYLSLVRHGDDPAVPGERVFAALPKDRAAVADAGAPRPVLFDLGDRATAPPPPTGVARGSAPLFVDADRIYLTLPGSNLSLKTDGSDPKDFFPLADGQVFRPTMLLSDDKFVYGYGVLSHDKPGDGIPAIVRQPKAGGAAEILRQEPGVSFLTMALDNDAIYLLEQRLGVRPSKRVSRMLKRGGDAPAIVEYDGALGANTDGALSGTHHMVVSSGFVFWDDDALVKVPTSGCAPAAAPDAGPDWQAPPEPPHPPPPFPGNDDGPPPTYTPPAPDKGTEPAKPAPAPAPRDKACSFAPPTSPRSTLPAWVGLALAGLVRRAGRRRRPGS